MRSLFTYCTIVLAITFVQAQQDFIDQGFKQCLVDSYPSLVTPDEKIDLSQSSIFGGAITCTEYQIKSINDLSLFPGITSLNFNRNEITDITVISSLTSLNQLFISENEISSIPDLSSISSLVTLHAWSNEITAFPSLPPSIQELNIGLNQIANLEGLENLDSLRRLHLYHNQLTSFTGVSNLTHLEELEIHSNNLDTIQDLSVLPLLYRIDIRNNNLATLPAINLSDSLILKVSGNRLSFDDFMPLTAWPQMSTQAPNYDIQQSIGDSALIYAIEGKDWLWRINIDNGISNTYYKWFRDGEQIDSTSEAQLLIQSFGIEHEGSYFCQLGNTALDSVTVLSTTREVVLTKSETASAAFSPDGDGEAETFYIGKQGTIEIVNKAGETIRSFQGPGEWDGLKDDLNKAPLGYYIIMVDQSPYSGVTLVR